MFVTLSYERCYEYPMHVCGDLRVDGWFFRRWIRYPEKCYGDLGCFNAKSPFNNALGHLPQSPSQIDIQFRLFTRSNPTNHQILDRHHISTITNSNFNGGRGTVFIVHGFQDSASNQWVKSMTSAFLQKEDMNVIAVDWSRGAAYINYYQAVANTRVVGADIAKMIERLHTLTGSSYSNMYIVGHSLGSHIGGYAGEKVPGKSLGRITGLDPAGPSFENKDIRVRLDENDAVYVDVIHTDGSGDKWWEIGFGSKNALGDSDFYPNGGVDQPGCPNNIGNHFFTAVTGQISELKDDIACSHMRVLDLFIESIISSCKFQSVPCVSKSNFANGRCSHCGNGCAYMGYKSQHNSRGKFYLTTNSGPPYCLH